MSVFLSKRWVCLLVFLCAGSLPLSSLRLLVSPLQLMSAALWGIVQHRAVKHYGLLEDFITAVQDHIPGALTYSERVHIILGLRAKVVLEMCKYEDSCYSENIEPHLKKMHNLIMEQDEESQSKMNASFGHFSQVIYSLLQDPRSRNVTYQKKLPSEFDLKFDSSMQTLIRKLILHLENFLPAPSLDQTSLWLGLSPSVLKDCEDILRTSELSNLIQHQKQNCLASPGHHVNDLICPDLLTENNAVEFQSLDIRVHEPQVTENTDEDVPSVEVTLCFDDDDEEDYKTNVTYKNQRQITINESFRKPVDDAFQSYGKHSISEHSGVCVIDNTILHPILNSETNMDSGTTSKSNSHSDNMVCLLCDQVYTHTTLLEHQKVCVVKYEQQKQIPAPSSMSLQQTNTSRMSKKCRSRKSHQTNTCHECGQMFTSLIYLKSHLRTHINGREKIDKTASTETIKKGEQKGIKPCGVVLDRLPPNAESVYNSNIFSYISIKPCNISCNNNVEMDCESQGDTSTKKSSMKCTLCDQTFFTTILLKRHYDVVHRVKGSYQCPSCKISFLRLWEMVQHHNNKPLYQCDTCKFYFTKPSMLRRHKKKLKNTCANSHNCEICGKSCITAGVLKQHLNKHKPKQTFCTICNKNFSDKYCLRVHMNRHTGGFPCSLCDKVFYQKTCLKRHMDRHNGTEQFLCDICGKGWLSPKSLKDHMLRHTEERPFKCDKCDKAYKRIDKLKCHLKSHLDVWPYSCDVCGKLFKHKSLIKDHKVQHTGVWPLYCPICGRGFVRKYVLRAHRIKEGH